MCHLHFPTWWSASVELLTKWEDIKNFANTAKWRRMWILPNKATAVKKTVWNSPADKTVTQTKNISHFTSHTEQSFFSQLDDPSLYFVFFCNIGQTAYSVISHEDPKHDTTVVLHWNPSYTLHFLRLQLCWICPCSQVRRRCWVSARQPTLHPAPCLSDSTSSRDGHPTTPRQIDRSSPPSIKYQVTRVHRLHILLQPVDYFRDAETYLSILLSLL